MAESKAKPVKEEDNWDDDDDNVPIAVSRARPVKKEEAKEEEEKDEDEDNLPLALSKAKKRKPVDATNVKKEETNGEENHKGKVMKEVGKTNAKISKPKKEEPEDSEEEDPKEESKRKRRKKKEEEKKVSGKKSNGTVGDRKEKKEKKVYVLPGQKHDPPEERDPLRIFYETLHEQVPRSEMAAMWMMEWGLLPLEEAKKVYETKLKKGQQQKLGSPIKLVSVKKTSSVSVKKTVVKTSRKASDSEVDDDDFVISSKKSKKQKVSS